MARILDERLLLAHLGFGGEDVGGVTRHVRDQHAPEVDFLEGAAQRDFQLALNDEGAQHLDAALLQGFWRHRQGVDFNFRHHVHR